MIPALPSMMDIAWKQFDMVADREKLSRRTAFYTRKVKYTQETFCEKFSAILDGFPRLQDIHPFRMLLVVNLVAH